jgi:hypothetical protein
VGWFPPEYTEVFVNTPNLLNRFLLLAAVTGAFAFSGATLAAQDCDKVGTDFDARIDRWKDDLSAATTDDGRNRAHENIDRLYDQKTAAVNKCLDDNKSAQDKVAETAKRKQECDAKVTTYGDAFEWNPKTETCTNKAEKAATSRSAAASSDECGTASMFEGDLKGQNCKKAMNTVRDVRARTGALTDATTAATTVYANMQANGATGAQEDAQTRQANVMKTLAISKMLTGALNIANAGQLKSAASGAEDANSAITGAQKAIAADCEGKDDEQACFYQNAQAHGISPDQRSFASFQRMKQAAQQSQDQADAANAMAKSSMITGAADLLVGLQAMKAAQVANNNAMQMAPPPVMPVAPPASQVSLAGGPGGPAAPSLEPGTVAPPQDFGNPANDLGTFGAQKHERMGGGSVKASGGPFAAVTPAHSGVSGGGGGLGAGGGAGLRGGTPPRQRTPARPTIAGEYNMMGGGKGGPAGHVGDKPDAGNPLADMLAKMFPPSQDGRPVVDTRQIASVAGGTLEPGEQADAVTAADLSIFEQISAKYRQLNGTGRF